MVDFVDLVGSMLLTKFTSDKIISAVRSFMLVVEEIGGIRIQEYVLSKKGDFFRKHPHFGYVPIGTPHFVFPPNLKNTQTASSNFFCLL